MKKTKAIKEVVPEVQADHVTIMEDKKTYLVRDVFYRPEHPDFPANKLTGWIASWSLMYKYNAYKTGLLYVIEECGETEEEARDMLSLYPRRYLKERTELQYI